ncbi:MAG: hypothetical protein KDD47_09325, partial [Acidobacteria bacterium]|nr:hypothetical protein [Acidobacteriota bacterium]
LFGPDRGEKVLTYPLPGGRLALRSNQDDELTRLLLSVAAAGFEAPKPSRKCARRRGGMVGESPNLLSVL